MDWIGWASLGVIGAGAAVAVWALFWNRGRGRLRCRKCAYDMAGVGLTCPECGKVHKSEKVLRRSRRKWKTVCLALAVVLLTLHYREQRVLIAYEGVVGIIPSIMLATFIDMDGYSSYSPNEHNLYHNRMTVYEAMDHRIDRVAMSGISRRIFAHRLARHAAQSTGESHEVRVHDVSGVIPIGYYTVEYRWDSMLGSSGLPEQLPTFEIKDSYEMAEGLLYVANKDWEANKKAVVGVVGDQLVIEAPTETHELIESVIRNCEKHVWELGDEARSVQPEDAMVGVVYLMPWTDDKIGPGGPTSWSSQVAHELLNVEPERWESESERTSEIIACGLRRIVIWASHSHHRLIQQYLNSIDLDDVIRHY